MDSLYLHSYLDDVEKSYADIEQRNVVKRLWQKDYSLWRQDPAEIGESLGWLTVTDAMRGQIPSLRSFAGEINEVGFRDVVLLGMGGSSLGALVMGKTFGAAGGYPRLTVLDSTVPAWVKSVTDGIDPGQTLFLVSSKSGTTIEMVNLFAHFKNQVRAATGKANTGQSFVAITDPGTPLVGLAKTEGFRRIFINPPDIVGRYSVLSYFGLVPAALSGVDITTLLERADRMREKCAPGIAVRENPAVMLGAFMGTMARLGRDKLTLITSPALSSFGIWAEQLLAESTGKEGKGIIPVAGEPSVPPDYYGSDRLFVYLRLEGDDNAATDAAVTGIKSAGHPVAILELADHYDLGGEFFRWEFATAIAGVILAINPFNQPNVEMAKKATDRVLHECMDSGQPPRMVTTGAISALLSRAGKGNYLAIMAYLLETPETDGVFADFRRRIIQEHRIATTLGYGPRFLHSTGQIHKGGPNTGLFLQITSEHEDDLPAPGKPYTFGVLADAEALGDFEALQTAGRRAIRIHLTKGEPVAKQLRAKLA
ncbi:MAG: glucose-6-phosphate isomerase [Chloroflexota bacterium]